jgi:hypothetical protein
MMLSVAASSRMDTAIAENESSAPVIHRTTRMRCLEVTLMSSLESLSRVYAIAVHHSSSGWFSGRARSKAASFMQAASMATSLGNRSSGTFRRRAL